MRLIPDFTSMSKEELFRFLKLGVARLFVLCIVGLAVAKAVRPPWLELAALTVVVILVSHAAIAAARGIRFLEQTSRGTKD